MPKADIWDSYTEYKRKLHKFLYYYNKLEWCRDLLKKGWREIDNSELYVSLLVDARDEFLEVKEVLGYTDGLTFLEDSAFVGFEIKGGHLIGSHEQAIKCAEMWLGQFNTALAEKDEQYAEDNHLLFELANYLLNQVNVDL